MTPAHLIAVLKLEVVPLGVVLGGHLSLPGYRKDLQLISCPCPLWAEEEHEHYPAGNFDKPYETKLILGQCIHMSVGVKSNDE